jgi:hypothetical protein
MIVERSYTIQHGVTSIVSFEMGKVEDRLFTMRRDGINMGTVTVTTKKGEVVEEVCTATVYMAWDY